jgi:hypothetical protein
LIADHSEYIELLERVEALPKVKKVFIRSGIRFDYMLADKSDAFFKKLVRDHVSGQLKVAPEHCSSGVLKYMGKPDVKVYDRFREKYFKLSKEYGLEQYLVPYLMSSHPGSTLNDAIELSLYLRDQGCNPEQVQDFYPTPGTASTVMYYTGINPLDMKPVYAPDDYREKLMQRALLQYRRPENRNLVREALIKAGREDLIGYGPNCLVAPDGRKQVRNAEGGVRNGKQVRNAECGVRSGKQVRNAESEVRNGKQVRNAESGVRSGKQVRNAECGVRSGKKPSSRTPARTNKKNKKK